MDRRIFFKNNTALVDVSDILHTTSSSGYVFDVVAAEDSIFVGSVMPFNHLFFKMKVPNDQASTVSVQFWNDSTFKDVIDLVDLTVGLQSDGIIKWNIPKDWDWYSEPESYNVTGLSVTEIYNLYWAKITFSADLKATTEITYVGQRFSSDYDLYLYYPELKQSNLLAQYETGKTSWDDQHIGASENIIMDLKARNIIQGASQILKPELLRLAAIHKTAEIIFSAFGKAYEDDKLSARKAYSDLMLRNFFEVDVNKNGRIDRSDEKSSIGWLKR